MPHRYDYAGYATSDAAAMALENAYADGYVSEDECPRIERRRVGWSSRHRYYITLMDWSSPDWALPRPGRGA